MWALDKFFFEAKVILSIMLKAYADEKNLFELTLQ